MRERTRFGFLDGMRGLAAFYVLLVHVRQQWDWKLVEKDGVLAWRGDPLPRLLERLLGLVAYGHFAVAVFIVLSGFCLMMPVARSADGALAGGLKHYIYRRAKRILPPYYAALILSLALIACVPLLRQPNGTKSDLLLPAFTPGVLISHLVLVHNINAAWIGKINPPLWSIPPEWQIYFLFPLVLLPVWRRFGLFAVNVLACVVSLSPHFLWHGRFDYATPWYLALFTFGLSAAAIRFSPRPIPTLLRERAPWGWIAMLIWIACATLIAVRPEWFLSRLYATDPIVGAGTAVSIIYLSRFVAHARNAGPAVLRILEARPIAWLGSFSYSLYLVHYPLLPLIHAGLRAVPMPPMVRFGVFVTLGIVIPLAFAYLFHMAFERPLLVDRLRSSQADANAAPPPAREVVVSEAQS
jgi:peptidoglycan/LPS O-acetylase OafA/YrhL